PTIGLLSTETPEYIVRLYGVTHAFGNVKHEFDLTASINYTTGSAILSNSKRFYLGAHALNHTGTVIDETDIIVDSFRVWMDELNNESIKTHNLDAFNYGHDKIYSNTTNFNYEISNSVEIPGYDSLILHWNFDNNSSADSLGEFIVEDFSSGSNRNQYSWASNIIEREKLPPFLLYLLHKNHKNNTMYFPNFKTENKVMDEATKNINEIFKDWSSKPHYKGFLETKHNIYLFYELKYEYILEKIDYHDVWWWTSIFEIVNIQKILNFTIDRTVYSLFYKKPLLISLFKKNNKLSSPVIGYLGGYYTYIAFAAAFGVPKQLPTASLGPYYYFSDYHGAGRWAIWSYNRKQMIVNDEDITLNEFGVFKKGGIARYAFFGDKIRYFLNRESDPEDDSKISQELANEDLFYKETLKVRDVSAKWADNHDMAYIGSFLLDNTGPRRYNINFAIRDFEQQVPLTYHYVDTTEIAKIDREKQASMPY
ncbi:hypothetical protein EB155_10660, partial [archaeon]|nr:hypothetical protein [archaeon]